jgi:hypothetical protein
MWQMTTLPLTGCYRLALTIQHWIAATDCSIPVIAPPHSRAPRKRTLCEGCALREEAKASAFWSGLTLSFFPL